MEIGVGVPIIGYRASPAEAMKQMFFLRAAMKGLVYNRSIIFHCQTALLKTKFDLRDIFDVDIQCRSIQENPSLSPAYVSLYRPYTARRMPLRWRKLRSL
jgi:hypothetical protein